MKKFASLLVLTVLAANIYAQKDTTWKTIYRTTPPKINNLVHTKLKITPVYEKAQLIGEEWVTLTPHFYPVNSVELNANSMDIKEVALVMGTAKKQLKYKYNQTLLDIALDRTYKQGEKYTLYISYTAKPNEVPKDAALMLENKGAYFINPDGKEPNVPIQLWTQGETEQASSWFPTIDRTAQKCTQEMYITVPNKYVTLSNGLMVSQTKNANGTRTDYWKMDLPHSPYLFFMGVGDYAVVKDTYKGKPVDYYVEKEYAGVAKQIFGNTPEMMGFFSKILGVEYPWQKYSQMVARDFVAGAMENTTATLHQEGAQQDARQLADQNSWEGTIAHELFHQWFGDYVTAENWTNLTLNESFADYSEYLWEEYKYGRDLADETGESAKQQYFSTGEKKDLVRFYYNSQEDMFDRVSYSKGGRILHMLRYYLGDEAFFKGLQKYLNDNKFKSAEAHDLRLAFEAVSGRDLNWFFNQWYYNSGHPKVTIVQALDEAKKEATITFTQTGDKKFIMPLNIDLYTSKGKTRTMVMIDKPEQTVTLPYTDKPILINVDGDRTMLWSKKETRIGGLDMYEALYEKAALMLDRQEAIRYFVKNHKEDKAAEALLIKAMSDKFSSLRRSAIQGYDKALITKNGAIEKLLINIIATDKNKLVVAAAINKLASLDNNADYKYIYEKNINDISYTVAGRSLNALAKVDLPAAKKFAIANKTKVKGELAKEIKALKYAGATEADFEGLDKAFNELDLQERFGSLQDYSKYIGTLTNADLVKKGIATIVKFREKAESFGPQASGFINNTITTIYKAQEKNKASEELLKYIESQKKVYPKTEE